jgi:hypothetical protein
MGPFGEADVNVYVLPEELSLFDGDCVVERKIDADANTCGELCLASDIASLAEKYGGVSRGSCLDVGYTVLDHTETVSMGPLGEADVNVYVLPDALSLSDGDCVVERKIDTDAATCGELCLDSSISSLAEKYGGVSPGTCADVGFSTFDHTEKVSAGPLGDLEVNVYTKAAAAGSAQK